jgi:hypothetical protein
VTVWFVDTSILCNIIPVPGKDQQQTLIKARLKDMRGSGDVLILPVTAVVETGNHISQLRNGHDRRKAATTLQQLVRLVIERKAPWQLHAFWWDEAFLATLIDGASTGGSLVEHAVAGLGCGDLCVLAERDIYRMRTAIDDVQIWTLDRGLAAYN